MADIPEPLPPALIARGLGLVIGVGAAVLGIVDGIVMIIHNKVEVVCPEDYMGSGSCWEYPQTAEGLAVIATSLMLGVLILFVASSMPSRPSKYADRYADLDELPE